MPPHAAPYPSFDPLAYAQSLKAAGVPDPQAEAQAAALRAAFLDSEARQQAAIEHATQAAREQGAKAEAALRALDAKTQQSVQTLDTRAERSFLELKADIAKTQADILELRAEIAKTQQAIQELKARGDVRHAETRGQLKLHNWMLTALLGIGIALLIKAYFQGG